MTILDKAKNGFTFKPNLPDGYLVSDNKSNELTQNTKPKISQKQETVVNTINVHNETPDEVINIPPINTSVQAENFVPSWLRK